MHGRGGGEERKKVRHMWTVPTRGTAVLSGDGDAYPCFSSSPTVDSFSKDGRKIRVGDCALFKPALDSPPFIGIIRCLIASKENKLNLGVNWLYRPAEVKLGKGILLEAAPNEIFYSFHEDETPAASLLHPCKVAFLPKDVELAPGICSFVCRRVYDITNKCLWWLTDQDYIKERQEEVDQLLYKTRLEMHVTVQPDGCSPKPVNGPTSTSQLKPGVEGAQNNSSSFPSQGKGKKRERSDQGSELVKRERTSKIDDEDSSHSRRETSLKFEIAKITENGGLKDSEGVEKLVHLMMPETNEKKIDLVSRSMLAGVIAATNNVDCLSCFIQLRGLRVFDEWLQEVHKGKIGDGSGSKDDRSIDDFLLTLLRALDKLPVNLTALQMCNIGKSVNHLRSHKNIEIQKKARSLVDTWKKRVEAEMDAKSGSNRLPEVSHCGSKHSGSTEVAIKSSVRQPSSLKTGSIKLAQGETATKCASASMGSMKAEASPASAGANLKDVEARNAIVVGSSDPQTTTRDEKSSSSSQSCSSDYGKTDEVSVKQDLRSSAAGSGSESNVCMPVGEDAGMNLLASVAAGALLDSAQRNVPLVEHSYAFDVKLKPSSGDEVVQDHNQSVESAAVVHLMQAVGDNSMAMNADSKISFSQEKSGDLNKHLTSSTIIADSCPGNGKLKEIASTTCLPTSSIGEKTTDIGNYKEHLEEEVLSPSAVPSVEVDKKKNITEGSERSSQSPQKSPIVEHPTKEIAKDALPPGFDKDSVLENVDEVKADKIVKVDAPSHAGESETANARKGEHEEKNLKDCEGNGPLAGSPILMETEQPMRPRESNLTGEETNDAEEGMSTTTDAPYTCGPDTDSKVEFDLNEGFNTDEGKFGDPNSSTASGRSVPVQLVNPVPLPVSPMLSSLPASITVAAAAKGPFVPPDDLLRSKGALGWKGSAATSAFRPAEPRKILDMPLVTSNASSDDASSGKQNRPPLDIDLNVHDERVLQDLASRCFANGTDSALDRTSTRDLTCGLVGSSPVGSSGGLDLDLNRVDEPADLGNHLTTSYSRRLDDSMHPIKSFSGILNSKVTVHRDFDLNNGPAVDEVSAEPSLFSHNARSSNASSQPPVSSLRMNTTEMANFSSWFPTENTYSSITLQSILPDREQPFPIVATGGPQRVLGPPIGAAPFNPDVYREPVLSSTSAVPLPSTHFQYPVFPFGTPFPLPSTSFSASSTTYVDSSPAGRFCFPPVPAQLLRPAGAVPSYYPRPYVISLPDGSISSNGGAENGRQWGRQGLDLNVGPGVPDIEGRDEMTPLAFRQLSVGSSLPLAEDQARMYQVPGGILKRKEPEGGWDGYKQSSWQ